MCHIPVQNRELALLLRMLLMCRWLCRAVDGQRQGRHRSLEHLSRGKIQQQQQQQQQRQVQAAAC
jgi:hypothetical protein